MNKTKRRFSLNSLLGFKKTEHSINKNKLKPLVENKFSHINSYLGRYTFKFNFIIFIKFYLYLIRYNN